MINSRNIILLLVVLFVNQILTAEERYEELVNKGIDFVIKNQKIEDNGEQYWAGEWSAEMGNVKAVIALGPKGKKATDANCFSTTLVHNELAKYVLRNDFMSEPIANALNLAVINILGFKSEADTFNFWHKLPMTERIKQKAPKQYRDELISRPNQYELRNTFAAVRSNIADDADDTAVAYSAMYLNKKLNEKYPAMVPLSSWSPNEIAAPFEKYRNLNRKSNPFNAGQGTEKNNGAYMTWLTEQNSSFMGSVFKGWDDELRIPEGSNNVDCVVNSNVLQMLAHYNLQNSEGAEAACRFIEKSIDIGIIEKCGLYYPNPYHLHFAVSEALEAGASCLQSSGEKLYKILLIEQNSNGSWGYTKSPKSKKRKIIEEPIASSIYAANALFTFAGVLGLPSAEDDVGKLSKAAKFIADSAIQHEDQTVSWPAGVFFSGGTFVRRLVIWKNEAYTTMLGVQALDRYNYLQVTPKIEN